MAPEQAAGRGTTSASDLYALGVMLFEALTGRLPFNGRTGEILAAKQRDVAPRVSQFVDVPVELDALIARLLQRSPQERPDLAEVRRYFSPQPHDVRVGTRPPPRAVQSSHELVGRARELSELRDAYQATLQGTPVVLRVSGRSGIGKSALIDTFVTQLVADGRAIVLSGRCHQRENVPYKGVDALVDELSRHLRRLPRDEAAALMPRDVDSLMRLFPVLAGVPAIAEAPQRAALDAPDVQRRAFAAFGELLSRVRDRQPLVLCIDDMQWTDADSVRFIRYLLSHPDPVPLMMVAAHRTDRDVDPPLVSSMLEAAADNRAISCRHLALGALDPAALTDLARSRLSDVADADVLATQIANEAQGYPLFVVEIARAVSSGESGVAPPTLESTLTTRVLSLSEEERAVLTVAALAGQPLPQNVAIAAARIQHGHAAIEALIDQRLIRVAFDQDGERVVDCFHERVSDWVMRHEHEGVLRESSRELARVLSKDRSPPPELLSRAWEMAGEHELAAQQAGLAAIRATQAFAFERAIAFYDKALLFPHSEPEARRALLVGRAEALARAARGPVAADAYLRAREGATPAQYAELTRKAGEQCVLSGRLRRGRELLAEGLRPLDIDLPLSNIGAVASTLRSHIQLRVGKLGLATSEDRSERTLQRLEALSSAAIALSRTDPVRTADLNARWTHLARTSGHAVSYVSALGWELSLAGILRRAPADIAPIERTAQRLCDQTGSPLARLWFHYGRGGYHLMRGQPWSGDFKQALEDFEHCVHLLKLHPHATATYDEPWVQYQRANALTMLGRLAEAHRVAQVQIEAAWSQHDLTILPAWALTASYVRAAVGETDQTERDLQRTRALWQPDDLSFQDLMLPAAVMVLAAYRGHARLGFETCQGMLSRLHRRWMGRVFFGHVTAPLRAIWGAAAVSELRDGTERRALVDEVRRASRQSQRWEPTLGSNARAALACAERNTEAAIRELRLLLTTPEITPTWDYAARRRLGVLLGGDEGRVLIAQADAFFRSGGVVDPERFTAAVLPGLEIRP